MHANSRRRLNLGIAMEPAWIIRSKHVRLDSELRKLRCELQRPLHANTARRGKIKTDDQNLHGLG